MLILVFLCGCSTTASSAITTGTDVTLRGALVREAHWGPPNFGETPKIDSRFDAWLIKLDDPIAIKVGAEIGKSKTLRVGKIQLNFNKLDQKQNWLRDLSNKEIMASGKLWTSTTPGDIAPVVMEVTQINLVAK